MIETYFNEGDMFPSSVDFAKYLDFPFYEQECINGHRTRHIHTGICKGCIKSYQQRNLHIYNAANSRRRSAKLNATPAWANQEAITEIYRQAKEISIRTGVPHDVDHEVPLQNKFVCGLHVENNLKIVTASENRQKHNKFTIH